MSLNQEIRDFLKADALERFLRYIKVHTTSEENTGTTPSTKRQFDLAKILKEELEVLGLQDIILDEHCYVYAKLPSNVSSASVPICFLAHVDTSDAVSGENVKPIIYENYDGSVITYPDNPDLTLSPSDDELLSASIGEKVITASGKTLLGADDKAGIAEIMAAMAAFRKYPELKHGEVRICFTPDEEIGQGTIKIDTEKLGKYCYTIDGSLPGELEYECFDAMAATITFKGLSVHPGFAKDKMVNALNIAARYLASLPEWETPEHTDDREGFYHLMTFSGNVEEAKAKLIIRDFEHKLNEKRVDLLKKLNETFKVRYPGLKIEMKVEQQYKNMRTVLNDYPEVMAKARKAIEMAGLESVEHPIRGGTDGARLSHMGIPTPNIFAGGRLFHSRKEWITESAIQKAAEVVILLAGLYAE
ncbi:peptidase T [bacterium]|nr:peptidase T [FCB group bacterium]MBL7190812.1 peptidase T [bacterium]